MIAHELRESEEEALIEQLVAAMRREPAGYRDVEDLVSAVGVGQTRLVELFRVYYHTTPADMLARLRVAAARRALLETSAALSSIAGDVGFESVSAFHDTFRNAMAMSPGDYRRMREAPTFVLALPEEYPAQRILGTLGAIVAASPIGSRARPGLVPFGLELSAERWCGSRSPHAWHSATCFTQPTSTPLRWSVSTHTLCRAWG